MFENIDRLKRESPLPLYYQLEEEIKRLLREGWLKEGEKIPSEREIASRLEISRMTAHRALDSLVQKNYLYREQGRGTFVAGGKKVEVISPLASFSREMENRGFSITSRVTGWKKREAFPEEEEKLQLKNQEAIFDFIRLRSLENVPVLREQVRIPVKFCPALKPDALENSSLYDIFARNYALELKEARATVEPVALVGEIAADLEVESGQLALYFEQQTYLSDGRPVELTRAYYRHEDHKFRVKLGKEYTY